MEVPLNIAVTSLRRKALLAALAALLLGGLSVLLLAGDPPGARAGLNPNETICKGHTLKGDADKDDPTLVQVKYTFACSNPITGYQIQSDHAVQAMETEVFGIDPATKQVVPTDSFSCSGDLPGYGVNCVGSYGGNWDIATGQFAIDEKLCDEPRVDPLLTVVYATADATGKVTQAIAGPFDLGRPRGCPKSARNGKWRIPQTKDVSTIEPTPAS
jgi:hypothetical protein